jgi:hypothetical protein
MTIVPWLVSKTAYGPAPALDEMLVEIVLAVLLLVVVVVVPSLVA